MIDWQAAFNVSVMAIGALGGWVLRTLWSAISELRNDLAELREHIPTTYISKADINNFKSELFHRLDRIEGKLDGKQDK